MKILLLECESPSSLSFLKFYKDEKDVRIVCGSSSKIPIVFFSKFRKKIYKYPNTLYPFYFSKKRIRKFNKVISNLVRKEKIDIIISQSEKTLIPLLSENLLKKHLPYPSLKTVNVLHDKMKLFNYLARLSLRSFKLPKVYENPTEVKYPIIIKPNKGAGGFLVKKINKKEELLKTIQILRRERRRVIIQEFIPSKLKLALNLFVDKEGKIKRLLSFRKIKISKLRKLKEEIENFFKEIQYFGFASPQFLIHKNQLFLIEINPRLSYYYYGLDFDLDFPEAFHRCIIKNEGIEERFKILPFPYPFTIANKIYLKETGDLSAIFINCAFTAFFSLTSLFHPKYP